MAYGDAPAGGKGLFFFTSEEIARSEAVFKIIEQLPSILDGACFFGAGAIGKSLVWHFRRAGLRVGHFIDNNPALWGKEVLGLPIVSPEEHGARYRGKPLVLALSRGFRMVREQCRRMGLSVVPHYLCRSALGVCPFGKRMTAAEIEGTPAAAAALGIWEDDASREKYRALVRFQALFDEGVLPEAEAGHYFSPVYMPRKYLHSIADVGACDGDTLREFLRVTGGDFTAYYAFEPDPLNVAKILAGIASDEKRVRVFTLAAGEKPGTVRMRGFGSLLSNIAEDGELAVPVDSLDTVLGEAGIGLVKIDVEGFEPAVLAGMREIMERQRPALAVSIYHQVDHLWSLPLRIKDAGAGYALKLGCHGDLYSEAVCYALPSTAGE